MQPQINIYTGIDGLAMAKKAELASRVGELVEEDLCDCCLEALQLQASAQGVEEFFNQCHGEGGKFCGGSTGSRGLPGKDRGPGTKRPAPIDYYKQRINTKLDVYRQRKISPAIRKVTVGPALGALTTASYGNVKIKKLAKKDLNDLSTGDLSTLRDRLKADQRFYNSFVLRTAAFKSVAGIGASFLVADWKTKNIPPQIDRVDKEVKTRFQNIRDYPHLKGKRPVGASSEEVVELQLESLLAAAGETEFKQPPESIINLVAEFLAHLEEDEDVSPEDKKKIFAYFK